MEFVRLTWSNTAKCRKATTAPCPNICVKMVRKAGEVVVSSVELVRKPIIVGWNTLIEQLEEIGVWLQKGSGKRSYL